MKKHYKFARNQAGVTLMELIIGLAIIGVIIAGVTALFGSADSQQKSNQIQVDLTAIRTAVKQLYFGQGGYGTANMNDTLVTAKKIPTTLSVDTSTSPDTISHAMNGTINIVGATTAYNVTVTNIPSDVCTNIMAAGTGWTTIKAGSAAARTLPITPVTAAADCGAANPTTMIFTGQ
ncbi:type 4 pilus major pilin [Methylovorus glucosotrophus]|uniref:PilS domain protein n=1 Tax=Methylovorus glucosotrophus (strain SIP3-4) TaxID=582744 RepID=C6XET4_METGS|nr:type 4 pilus major pilin [Methylovorus glucosotrophus]ACT52141.1 PilS domain protein [Methylovorus glucosotrophus SIP3-4]